MNKINKQLIKAGLYYLIDKDKESFIDQLSLYLQERSELMNFLFEGPLPINEEIKQKLEEHIKSVLPSPEYFKEIVEIGVDFDYDSQQQYKVTYKVTRFYDTNKQPWNGQTMSDNTHTIPIITNVTINIYPSEIKK